MTSTDDVVAMIGTKDVMMTMTAVAEGLAEEEDVCFLVDSIQLRV